MHTAVRSQFLPSCFIGYFEVHINTSLIVAFLSFVSLEYPVLSFFLGR